jgi:opacity protein-like surface antigen
VNQRLLLAAVASAVLMSTSAQAATNIYYQSFTGGLNANESVGGSFGVNNGQVGHQSGYRKFDYSFYELSLDLTDVLSAELLFDYDIASEVGYDGFNVLASTDGVFDPPKGLLTPITSGFYAPIKNPLPKLGNTGLSGTKKGTVVFDLSQFTGQTVDLRFQFQADYFADGRGVLLDNLIVNGELAPSAAVPEPNAWALMILGFGAAGSILRRRRAAFA